jgi:type IV pilus assembly protein PilV
MHTNLRAHRNERGFSLVESMIALVVLSVGMIGMAALYSQGLGAGRTAQFRNLAINLVADMADRIRMNRLGQADYGNLAANNACDPQSGGGVDCTPDMMAAHDLFVWNQQVQQSLPNGAGLVQFNNATNPPTYTVQVSWDEVGAGNLAHQVVLQVPTF